MFYNLSFMHLPSWLPIFTKGTDYTDYIDIPPGDLELKHKNNC